MNERKINILGVGEYKKNLEDVTHYIDDCINRLYSSVKNLSSGIIKGDVADKLDEAYQTISDIRNEVNQELDSFTDWLGENIENSTLLDERHAKELEKELDTMDFFKEGYTIKGGNAFLTGDNNLSFDMSTTSSIVDSNLFEKYKSNPNAPWSNETINKAKETQMKEEIDKIMKRQPWESSLFNVESLKETPATPSNATPSNATPSNATPSNATPSNATPSNATPSNATPSKSGSIVDTNLFEKYKNNPNAPWSNETINEVKETQMKEEVDKIMNRQPWKSSL